MKSLEWSNGWRGAAVLLGAALTLVPAPALAQCADDAAPAGHLGIAQIECDCVVRAGDPTEWRFRSEPTVLRVEAGSPADGWLQPGDVITAVNGLGVTSAEGATAFGAIRPGTRVSLTVRRAGAAISMDLTPAEICPTDPRRLGSTPALQLVQAVPVLPARGTAVVSPVRGATDVATVRGTARVTSGGGVAAGQAITATRGAARVTGVVPSAAAQQAPAARVPLAVGQAAANGWIGLAFSCSDCTLRTDGDGRAAWRFGSPPEIYSVEQGSPAHAAGLRRGDVLLQLDDAPITSDQAGRRWATLEPGDQVRIGYRREGRTLTTTLRVGTPVHLRALQTTLAGRDSTAARVLREYEAVLKQQAEQEAALGVLVRRVQSATTQEQRQEVERTLQQHLTRQRTLRSRQELQLQELTRALQSSAQRLEASLVPLTNVPSRVTAAGARVVPDEAQRLRFSGSFGDSDIEVRGPSTVTVTERDGELIITTRDATIRLIKR